MSVMILLVLQHFTDPTCNNHSNHSEVKLLLVRIPYLLFLGKLSVVDRAYRAEGVQGKHRLKKDISELDQDSYADISHHLGNSSSQRLWTASKDDYLKWVFSSQTYFSYAFKALVFSLYWMKTKQKHLSTVYSLHPPGAGRFCIFWSLLCPQSSWGPGFLKVTLDEARIDHVFQLVGGLSEWKYIMPLLLFSSHSNFPGKNRVPE